MAAPYQTICHSERRAYSITVGLRKGYEQSAQTYSASNVTEIIRSWISERKQRGEPYLTGVITEGEVIYGGSGSEGTDEPVAVFRGEIEPRKIELFKTVLVETLLNDLSDKIGEALKQKELYICLDDKCWIRSLEQA